MGINDQLDENAPDLSGSQADAQPPQVSTPPEVVEAGTSRSVSKAEIILAIGILIGVVVIVYFILQNQATPTSSAVVPVSQPLHVGAP